MRKISGVFAVMLIIALISGTAALAKPFTQKGYDVEIEYYFVQEDMFMYLHDNNGHLLAIGLDNEGCLVYGEWDHETGGVKQALNEYGEEYVIGVHPAPSASKIYPIPEIAYNRAKEKRAALDKENQEAMEAFTPSPNAITYEEYMAFKAQAQREGVDFVPSSYIPEKQKQMKTQAAYSATSLTTSSVPPISPDMDANRSKWSVAVQGYPLHPRFTVMTDEQTYPYDPELRPGSMRPDRLDRPAPYPRGGKDEKTWILYVMFEGESKLKEGAIQLAPSYWNDLMFSDSEWRPYVDERYFKGELTIPDKFSHTYAILTGNKLSTPMNPVVSMDAGHIASFNAVSQDRSAIRSLFLGFTASMTPQERNLYAFEHGIYHGSNSHMLWHGTGGRYALQPTIDDKGRGGIIAVTVSEDLNEPIDNAGVQESFGVNDINRDRLPLLNAAGREMVKKVDARQFGLYDPDRNLWMVYQWLSAGGLIMTGYSWEFSAEKCVLGRLPGLWGQGAAGIVVPAEDCPPEYEGAGVSVSFFSVTSHCLDESRVGEGTEAILDYWPTRPRQFVVYAHELAHSTMSIVDVYDSGAQDRDLNGGSSYYPRYIKENLHPDGRIDVVNTVYTGDAALDPKNWMPGTRYNAGFGNWGIQGIGGYMGAGNEDIAARGGNLDPWNLVDQARIIKPRVLNKNENNIVLKYGEVMQIKVAPPPSSHPVRPEFDGTGFYIFETGNPTDIYNQLFYLSIREDRLYDQGVFDWARGKMAALSADKTFEGNLSGDQRYSIRSRLARSEPIPTYLTDYRSGGGKQNETAFAHGKGGLLITHVDMLREKLSSFTPNADASYGLYTVNAEAHAYPSGIFTLGEDAPAYPDLHKYGNDNYDASADITLLDGKVAIMNGKSASKDSHPVVQHMLERFSTDRARGEHISYDVRVNGGDPADLFNQWGVDEFVNPRLFSGDSRVYFENAATLTPDDVYAKSADIIAAMDRQRRPTGPVAPFAIRNIRYYHNEGGADDPTVTNAAGEHVSYVVFDFEITVNTSDIDIFLSSADMLIPVNQTRQLDVVFSPDAYPGDRTIKWNSSNEAFVTVSDTGLVTALALSPLPIVIRATLSDDSTVYAECNVRVPIVVTGVSISPAQTSIPSLDIGDDLNLIATVNPGAAYDKRIIWSTSNENVASVDQTGKVTAVGGGTATITVTTLDGGYTDSRNVAVIVPVTGVSVTPTSATILVGNTQVLSHTVTPSNATSPDVTWTSSNTAVATVSNTGTVTGVAVGTAVIRVSTDYGPYQATCNVTVDPSTVPVTGVTVAPTSVTLEIGGTQTLIETVIPSNATNTAVTWSNNGSTIASVSGGVVTALAEGNATITVTTVDGLFPATCSVTVTSGLVPTVPTYPADVADVAAKTGIDPGELEAKDGKVYLAKSVAEALAKSMLNANKVNTNIQPVFEGTVAPDGQTAQLSIMMTGKDLLASYPDDIKLIGKTLIGDADFFDYVSNVADFRDGKFTLLSGSAIHTGEIDPNATYELLVFVKDGGDFDLDGFVDGHFITSVFLASAGTGGSGGGGCSALGYLAFALLAVPFIFRKKR